MKAIASFPRSGNHLVRFVVEFITGRPTRGCLGNPADVPIRLNVFDDEPTVLAHVTEGPFVAQKAHSWEELLGYASERLLSFDGILLICRNPFEAIAAHLTVVPGGTASGRVSQLATQWCRLLANTVSSPIASQLVWYEDLISNDARLGIEAVGRIARLFWRDVDPERLFELLADLERFRAISAAGRGRAWAPPRSLGQPGFSHMDQLGSETATGVAQEIDRQLRETAERLIPLLTHSQERLMEVRDWLQRYLNSPSNRRDG